MPLPPALLARLSKRGIVAEQPQAAAPKLEEVEEVFAEDYDDPSKLDTAETSVTKTPVGVTDNISVTDEEDDGVYVHEVTACPNRSNPYHVCVKYCKNRWGMKKFSPEKDMVKRRDRMLAKYPLPEGWREVADPDVNRYYYWNLQTDQVCWLSPGHPKAIITMSAEKLNAAATGRTRLSSLEDDFDDDDTENIDDKIDAESDMQSDSTTDSESEEDLQTSRRDQDAGRNRAGRGQGWRGETNRRGRKRKDDLDPMDPAAYSDIPRGSWTDGLDMRGSAKTGVDVTASGPLFQQRPYPSPGDILRANQQLKKKSS